MKVIQSRSFGKAVKKFNKEEKKTLDGQLQKILGDRNIGQQKKGDLRDIYVHKFKVKNVQYLLSYRHSSSVLELIMIGQHENYYKELKKYLKGRG